MRNAGNILAAARRYLRITQLARCGPHKRIRARAFFANGVKEFCVAGVVQALPVMIHLTLFTFLAGLLVYLFNIKSPRVQIDCLLGGTVVHGTQFHHIYADLSARQALLFAAFPNSLVSSRHYPIFYPQSSRNEA